MMPAHVMAYRYSGREIDDGYEMVRTNGCRNKLCCNPSHLMPPKHYHSHLRYLMNQSENISHV
jgi:hypothetical protein